MNHDSAHQHRISYIKSYGPLLRIFTGDKREPWKFQTSDGWEVQPRDFHKMLINGDIRAVPGCKKIMGMPCKYEAVS